MLHSIAEKCTEVLIRHKTVPENQKAIYVYGFELFWSTTFCVVSILTLGSILGYLNLAIMFILYFMPIRVAAGGYHAKTYRTCFLLTNSIAITCSLLSKLLWKTLKNEYIMWIAFLFCCWYIWVCAPVISSKYPLKEARIIKNRKYAHVILIGESILLLFIRELVDNCMFLTGIIAYFAVAIMIFLQRREGE